MYNIYKLILDSQARMSHKPEQGLTNQEKVKKAAPESRLSQYKIDMIIQKKNTHSVRRRPAL